MATLEKVRQQSDLREAKEMLASALDAEEEARRMVSGVRKHYQECHKDTNLARLLCKRLEKGILTVALLLIVALSGCSTGRAFGGLLKGVGDDTITLFNGIENEIRNQK
jgi:hypothetical protein